MMNLLRNIVLLSIFLISSNSHAQIAFGPKIGWNTNYNENLPTTGPNFYMGFNGGATVQYKIKPWLSIQTGVEYSNRKNTYQDTATKSILNLLRLVNINPTDSNIQQFLGAINTDVYETTKGYSSRHHIDIPLNIILHTGRVEWMLGGYASILANARNREEFKQDIPLLDAIALDDTSAQAKLAIGFLYPSYYAPTSSDFNGKARYASFHYGLNFGVAYKTNDGWIFGSRLSIGLNEIMANPILDKRKDVFINTYLAYSLDKLIFKNISQPSFN
jgi:hypothetical protein